MNRAVVSWCLYDLANTIFAINITSYHFPVWIVAERGASQLAFASAFGLSMLLSALCMPWAGARSDARGRRVPALAGWTLACVLCTAGLGAVGSAGAALILFAAANFCYQLAGIFYNALLPSVSPAGRMGRVSGAGVAWGYVGTLLGVLAAAPFAAKWGRQATFLPTAVLFLVLALPSFLWVPEGEAAGPEPAGLRFSCRGETFRRVRPFLFTAFWGLAAVGTVILFMSVYAKEAAGLSDAALHRFILATTVAAIAGAFLWGRWTDRLGGARALWWVWAAWAAALAALSASTRPEVFWPAGCLAGFALSGTWVASRVLLVDLVGPERAGEAFGLFGLVSRISAILGPLLWGLILWAGPEALEARYRLAVLGLLVLLLAGWGGYHRWVRSGKMQSPR